MATKVGLAAVSYRIAVQNRYSAFLEDEDGLISNPNIVKPRPENQSLSSIKQNKSLVGSSSIAQNSLKAGSQVGKVNGRQIGLSNNKPEQNKNQVDQLQKRTDGKRQPSNQHQGTNNNVQRPNKQAFNHRQVNNNQDNTANNNNSNRFARSYSNQHHQLIASQHQSSLSVNKENNDINQHGKFTRNNNQRPGNRRQLSTDDKKDESPLDDFIAHTLGQNAVAQSSEEEKLRRQQKRALDMKYKDPEKREARRQQTHVIHEQSTAVNDAEQVQTEIVPSSRGQRNRRQYSEGSKGQEEPNRGFKGSGRGRGRREDTQAPGERRDGVTRGPRLTGDRQQSNKNGLAVGSRGSHGSRGNDSNKFRQESDRQKPIPNFSDKLDFPSLVS